MADMTLKDDRPKLVIDPKKLAMWEMEMIEGTTTQGMFVLCRYLEIGGRKVSPDLPDTPTDELSRKETAQIKGSKAYKILRRFQASEMEAALSTIRDGAGF